MPEHPPAYEVIESLIFGQRVPELLAPVGIGASGRCSGRGELLRGFSADFLRTFEC